MSDPMEWWDEVMGGLPRPDRVPTPPMDSSDRRYVCTHCKAELRLDYCKRVERITSLSGEPALVRIVHHCPCREWVRATRYPWDEAALKRLFKGSIPNFPWPRVYGEDAGRVDADPPDVRGGPAVTHDDQMAEWAWHLGGVVTAHDFLLFCRGPRDDLAGGA